MDKYPIQEGGDGFRGKRLVDSCYGNRPLGSNADLALLIS